MQVVTAPKSCSSRQMGEIAHSVRRPREFHELLTSMSGSGRGPTLMVREMDHAIDNPGSLAPKTSRDGNSGLVAQVQQGDIQAFEKLVAANQGWLMRLICRLIDPPGEAEDVLQDVLVAIYQGLSSFRHEAKFATWATTIAVNRCRKHRRRSARRKWLISYLRHTERAESAESGEGTIDDVEEVRRAVRGLPEKYREPVVLHYFEHLSMKDIASVLDLKTNTIEVRISRARQLLRTVLTERTESEHE